MEKKFKLGIIGGGFMANAIVKSLLNAQVLSKNDVIISSRTQKSVDNFASFKIKRVLDNKFVADNSEFLLIAVKPQNYKEVALSIKESKVEKVISIMAGVKKDKIKSDFNGAKVARIMPNTPCSINCGAMGADCSDFSGKDLLFLKKFLLTMGKVIYVNEEKFSAVTGISGSAPAYFYLFVESIIQSGVKSGLSYEDAKTLAVSTMIGSGKMVENCKDKSIQELIDSVCSKGGTTIEAVNVFKKNKLDKITNSAIKACIKRSKELENL